MTFFLIVPSVMIVTSFLVHAICNRLGLRIHFLTLAMSSFLAIAANLGALALTDVPSKFYFIKLCGIIFFATVIVATTNHFLVKREIAEQEEFVEKVKQAYGKKDEVVEEKIFAADVAAEKVEEKNISAVEEKVLETEDKKISDAENSVAAEKVLPVEVEKISEPEKVEIKKVDEKPEEIKSEVKVQEKSKTISEVKVETEKVETKPVAKVEKVSATEKVQPIEKVDAKKLTETEEKLPPLKVEVQGETLDEILDYAYIEKQQGHSWQAIAAYKKALEKYKNDEYAPFVAIDLANIYKEQSFYTKAIKTIEDAQELPAVRRNASTKAEFKKNLIYLKTVQSVLLRHKALATPFSKISRAYLQEIETEFQATQLKFED